MTRASLAFLITFCATASLAEDASSKATLVAKLSDTRINESSGLAIGRRNPGLFWTLNDSGGGPFVFAVDDKGSTRARFEIAGAANFDWEDIASGPDADGRPTLFLGDIGDNFFIRAEVQVYQLEEPAIDPAAAPMSENKVTSIKTLRASYPDGQHNAESLLCHPQTGRLFIITKTNDGQCGVYAFPATLQADTCMMLESVAQFQLQPVNRPGKRPIDNCMATGACFSPDATRIVVSTYCSLYQWTLGPAQTLAEAFAQKPLRIVPPLLPQNEAVCYSADGKNLFITSERLPTPLWRIEAKP